MKEKKQSLFTYISTRAPEIAERSQSQSGKVVEEFAIGVGRFQMVNKWF
ncbi:hypothetical protein chiPu_0029305, partial [Chiloscyllium punctatum]|nr:hypothetical protein [Chiloscyllium punctatum]